MNSAGCAEIEDSSENNYDEPSEEMVSEEIDKAESDQNAVEGDEGTTSFLKKFFH